jgi:hypothetical protein
LGFWVEMKIDCGITAYGVGANLGMASAIPFHRVPFALGLFSPAWQRRSGNPKERVMNKRKFTGSLSAKLSLLLVAGTLAAKTQASVIDLVLTEYDNNTLGLSGADAAAWTISGSGDSWTATRSGPLQGMASGGGLFAWTEPDNANTVNTVNMTYTVGAALTLAALSDVPGNPNNPFAPSPTGLPDGTVVSFTFYDANGGAIPYTVQFLDLGDGSAVPDGGSTALLAGLGLLPLLCLHRRRTCAQ